MISSIDANPITRKLSIENTRPIIGIVGQPVPSAWFKPYHTTYVAASYVKFIEATGAQVVPIRLYQSTDYYLYLFNSLNGVLFTGGDLSDEYLSVTKLFYTWSIEEFDQTQKVFPIWGTCLGFEVLLMLTKSKIDVLDTCHGYNFATELIFMPDAAESRLLGSSLPSNIKNAVENEPTTSNYHHFCMRPQNFTTDPVLSSFYKMLTTSMDLDGKPFISTIESRRYPIFAVQWHPEVNGFEWAINTTVPHTKDAIQVTQYMGNFFTDQCRQNPNHFDSLEDEVKYLIYQYPPEFMNLDTADYQQIYFLYP